MLLGADLQLSQGEVQSIRARYQSGQLSILLAEGNTTNAAFLGTVYGATVSGAAIVDRSSPFKDQRIFTVTLKLGATTETGVIDIASPIQANSGSVLRPAASSSANSFDAPVLAQLLAGLNTYYASLPAQAQGFFQNFGISIPEALARVGIAMLLLLSVYGAVRRWFAPEMKGKDDQPIPSVERSIVAESRSRIDFLTTSRNKSFYVATLARLYEGFDDIMTKAFRFGTSSWSIYAL